MVPFWKEDLSDLLSNLLKSFVKPASVSQCFDSLENIKNSENWLDVKNINIGFAAEGSVRKIIRKDLAQSGDIRKFRKDCRIMVVKFLEKIHERYANLH